MVEEEGSKGSVVLGGFWEMQDVLSERSRSRQGDRNVGKWSLVVRHLGRACRGKSPVLGR